MSDDRTRVQKVRDMADQSASPNEAKIAQAKLRELRVSPAIGRPRRRPEPVPFRIVQTIDDEGRWDG